ncbi:DNA methyltransferase [Owenweeksia hongkongensis]|uniref:DNA methyltransferase n=1 Tax=Owenweeksia hongkongensis TaxID=253245 RepID=UPI003A8F8616
MQLFEHVKEVLSKNESFCKDGKLFKNNVVEAALKLDAELLTILLKDDTTKKHFFTTVEGVQVFDKVKFQQFVSNKQFLPDSYTTFKNKIGLTANREYLTEANEVVLDFPYKDCILEGGQTKEDQKRKEIFWNETLASDEIDRLFEPKVLTNWKKYDKEGQQTIESYDVDNDNLVIKGNNLLVLHSIKTILKGKVKLIYIDPPYNTGNDGFNYNDKFNHSTWLTFMKNRLEVAKELLTNDGSIFISIDEGEIGYLQILLNQVFGQENQANLITIKRGSVTGHKAINAGVVNITEYVLVYSKEKALWNPNRVYQKRARNDRYNSFILNRDKDITEWEFCSLLDAFSNHLGIPKTKVKKQLGASFENEIYDFVKSNSSSVIQIAYPDEDKVSKDVQELIKTSKSNPKTVYHHKREKESDIYLKNGQRLLFYSDRLMNIDGELVTGEPLSDYWGDVLPNDLHNEGGVKLKKGKKPEKLIKRILEIASNEGDLVLDFHIGSGTTCAVAHKLGRRYIGIEQLDYGENDSVNRLKNVIDGEQAGISKSVDWKGGGSFVYAELAENATSYISKIETLKSTKEAVTLWNELKEEPFISYRVSPSEFDANIDSFEQLALDDQKKLLISTIDKNHLYINYADIEDKTYNISDADKKLNLQFYNR